MPQPDTDGALAVALGLLAEMVDPDPCDYDERDWCQAHAFAPRPCTNERAKRLLRQHARPATEAHP